jgi:hypothetical protein
MRVLHTSGKHIGWDFNPLPDDNEAPPRISLMEQQEGERLNFKA